MKPFSKALKKPITEDDISKLTDLRIKRISKYDLAKAQQNILLIENEIKEVKSNINNLVAYATSYYEELLSNFGKGKDRKTVIQKFDNISARRVAIANKKLYVNR